MVVKGIQVDPPPICSTMVVVTEGWPGWIGSLVSKGCQSVVLVLEGSWNKMEVSWVKDYVEKMKNNVEIVTQYQLVNMRQNCWTECRSW
eukprot:14499042-Ditylum_brightwellii.AAC.2